MTHITSKWFTICAAAVAVLMSGGSALAGPSAGQSSDVVIIGGSTLDMSNPCSGTSTDANAMGGISGGGGCLQLTGTVTAVDGTVYNFSDYNFSPIEPANVTAANLAAYDTAVLNMASSALACVSSNLSQQSKDDLNAWVKSGHKLIIYDSECTEGGSVDYSWLPYPFTTDNPGARGAPGTLTVVEDNQLSTKVGNPDCSGLTPGSFDALHCINATHLGQNTDAVGDMNVMTTLDPAWFLDMSGTNDNQVTGPVHVYATIEDKVAQTEGLYIYNGLDQDPQYNGDNVLRQVWIQELQTEFNPANLPGTAPVIGINLTPDQATNPVGMNHTVTATVTDVDDGTPQADIEVTFEVVSGPNAGASGTCMTNADCTTDAGGDVSFTYAGTGGPGVDTIKACLADDPVRCDEVTKEWVAGMGGYMTGFAKLCDKAHGCGCNPCGSSACASGSSHCCGCDDKSTTVYRFELHCDAAVSPNTLVVRYNKKKTFVLDNLISGSCNDTGFNEGQPVAGFDTYLGYGSGRLNGIPGFTASWIFTDAGEPGAGKDSATIEVKGPAGFTVFSVSGKLSLGNNQAYPGN